MVKLALMVSAIGAGIWLYGNYWSTLAAGDQLALKVGAVIFILIALKILLQRK